MRKRRIPRADRIRNIPDSFAWVDHRLRRDGHLEELTPFDITVYFSASSGSATEGDDFDVPTTTISITSASISVE